MSYRGQSTAPGEWQVDENGKRYRMRGHIKEYEMMIHTSGGVVPESELEAFNKMQKEARDAMAASAARTPPVKITFCPVSMMRGGFSDKCMKEECALYAGGKCELSQGDTDRDTAGLRCPFDASRRKCFKDCELYKGGCTIAARKRTK